MYSTSIIAWLLMLFMQINRAGKMSDEKRNEGLLLADVLLWSQ